MIQPFHVNIPMFRMSVCVCGNCSSQEAVDAFYAYEDKRTVLDPTESTAWVQYAGGDLFMWVSDVSEASVVFHELVHVAFGICEIRGMEKDEELIAYLMGWLKVEVADKLFELAEEN